MATYLKVTYQRTLQAERIYRINAEGAEPGDVARAVEDLQRLRQGQGGVQTHLNIEMPWGEVVDVFTGQPGMQMMSPWTWVDPGPEGLCIEVEGLHDDGNDSHLRTMMLADSQNRAEALTALDELGEYLGISVNTAPLERKLADASEALLEAHGNVVRLEAELAQSQKFRCLLRDELEQVRGRIVSTHGEIHAHGMNLSNPDHPWHDDVARLHMVLEVAQESTMEGRVFTSLADECLDVPGTGGWKAIVPPGTSYEVVDEDGSKVTLLVSTEGPGPGFNAFLTLETVQLMERFHEKMHEVPDA